MEIINSILEGRFPIKSILLMVLVIVFILGLVLLVSGIKIKRNNKLAKALSITLGIIFILTPIFFSIAVIFFGFNS